MFSDQLQYLKYKCVIIYVNIYNSAYFGGCEGMYVYRIEFVVGILSQRKYLVGGENIKMIVYKRKLDSVYSVVGTSALLRSESI